MRNTESLVQQSIANKDILLWLPSAAGVGHRNTGIRKWIVLGEGLGLHLF